MSFFLVATFGIKIDQNPTALIEHGNDSIAILIKQFSQLGCVGGFDEAEAMNQWERLEFEAPSMPFFTLQAHDLLSVLGAPADSLRQTSCGLL